MTSDTRARRTLPGRLRAQSRPRLSRFSTIRLDTLLSSRFVTSWSLDGLIESNLWNADIYESSRAVPIRAPEGPVLGVNAGMTRILISYHGEKPRTRERSQCIILSPRQCFSYLFLLLSRFLSLYFSQPISLLVIRINSRHVIRARPLSLWLVRLRPEPLPDHILYFTTSLSRIITHGVKGLVKSTWQARRVLLEGDRMLDSYFKNWKFYFLRLERTFSS